jgi:regulator of protease activity HflC (stomatin/prohibitin superfamily)
MIPIAFFKSEPTEYTLVYKRGRIKREGSGLAFFYWKPTTSVVLIPTSTTDAPFLFNEMTGDFQAVTVQGQVTYRIAEPKTMATLLNFTVNPRTKRYLSEDPDSLAQRIVNVVQAHTRNELAQLSLDKTLRQAEAIASRAMAAIKASNVLTEMGVECVSIFITSIKPIPEIAKALEADYREALQKRADEAIYARRAAAVEQERKIKENELSTQVALEQQRKAFVELEGENTRKAAEFEAEAIKARFAAYQTTDPRVLVALSLKELAENAEKIGSLMITPELLGTILDSKGTTGAHGRG